MARRRMTSTAVAAVTCISMIASQALVPASAVDNPVLGTTHTAERLTYPRNTPVLAWSVSTSQGDTHSRSTDDMGESVDTSDSGAVSGEISDGTAASTDTGSLSDQTPHSTGAKNPFNYAFDGARIADAATGEVYFPSVNPSKLTHEEYNQATNSRDWVATVTTAGSATSIHGCTNPDKPKRGECAVDLTVSNPWLSYNLSTGQGELHASVLRKGTNGGWSGPSDILIGTLERGPQTVISATTYSVTVSNLTVVGNYNSGVRFGDFATFNDLSFTVKNDAEYPVVDGPKPLLMGKYDENAPLAISPPDIPGGDHPGDNPGDDPLVVPPGGNHQDGTFTSVIEPEKGLQALLILATAAAVAAGLWQWQQMMGQDSLHYEWKVDVPRLDMSMLNKAMSNPVQFNQ